MAVKAVPAADVVLCDLSGEERTADHVMPGPFADWTPDLVFPLRK